MFRPAMVPFDYFKTFADNIKDNIQYMREHVMNNVNNMNNYVRFETDESEKTMTIIIKHSAYTLSRLFNKEEPVHIFNEGKTLYKKEPTGEKTEISPKEGTDDTYDLIADTTDRSFELKIDSNISGHFIVRQSNVD